MVRSRRGVTLIELAVVLMLTSIVATILVTFLASVFRVSTRATNDSEAQKSITLTLRPVTENIRGTASGEFGRPLRRRDSAQRRHLTFEVVEGDHAAARPEVLLGSGLAELRHAQREDALAQAV